MSYQEPTPLTSHHVLEHFVCSSTEQTQWLTQHARQSASGSSTKVFVVAEANSEEVIAYYSWCMAQIQPEDAPERLTKGAGRYPQPMALLARLGVSEAHEGKGLGAALLRDVLVRLLSVSDEIGCRGLLVHAESPDAASFYKHLIPGFTESPTDGMHLVLLLKDIRMTLARA